jgi:hypothetical protein
MADLSSLANIPFYGAYVAKKQMNENQGLQELQRAGALMQLQQNIQAQQQRMAATTRQATFAEDMAAATTPEQRREVAMRYASPEDV